MKRALQSVRSLSAEVGHCMEEEVLKLVEVGHYMEEEVLKLDTTWKKKC